MLISLFTLTKVCTINWTTIVKRLESPPEIKSCKDIAEFTCLFRKYINWYNNDRISNKTKNMSPVDFRTHVLAT
ncbi:IS3 family transposase [Ligilactobacillus equi]|uniref:IS3 family transposase n=1 Tax=Ligilactobacillus equi TaxID=137357 RepID=UPI003B5057FA